MLLYRTYRCILLKTEIHDEIINKQFIAIINKL